MDNNWQEWKERIVGYTRKIKQADRGQKRTRLAILFLCGLLLLVVAVPVPKTGEVDKDTKIDGKSGKGELKYINTSFSMHLAAYDASLALLSGSNVTTAFISPMVPIDRRSSISSGGGWYFFTICATRRRFRSIRMCFASRSPSVYFCI